MFKHTYLESLTYLSFMFVLLIFTLLQSKGGSEEGWEAISSLLNVPFSGINFPYLNSASVLNLACSTSWLLTSHGVGIADYPANQWMDATRISRSAKHNWLETCQMGTHAFRVHQKTFWQTVLAGNNLKSSSYCTFCTFLRLLIKHHTSNYTNTIPIVHRATLNRRLPGK